MFDVRRRAFGAFFFAAPFDVRRWTFDVRRSLFLFKILLLLHVRPSRPFSSLLPRSTFGVGRSMFGVPFFFSRYCFSSAFVRPDPFLLCCPVRRSKLGVQRSTFAFFLQDTASPPRSSVRIRIASSTSVTKTFPSPIFPVLADCRIASTTR